MKKRLLSLILFTAMIFSALSTVIAEEVTDDYTFDSSSNTYTVYTFTGLQTVAGYINGGNYGYDIIIGDDIALTSAVCIGTNKSNPYSGTINGNGHIISGVIANAADTSYQAFIRYTGGAVIKDLTLNVAIDAGSGGYSAGFVANNVSGVTFEGCNVSGTVAGASSLGGFIGLNSAKATFRSCSSSVSITSSSTSVGGFIGSSAGAATFSDCEVLSCTISSSGNNAGGLVGVIDGTLTAEDCTVYGATITSSGNYAGGIAGRMNCASFTADNIAVSADISAAKYTGGIIGGDGYASSTASDVSTYPKITLTNIVTDGSYNATSSHSGGIIGYNVNVDLTLMNVVTFADITTPDYGGGVAAVLRGNVLSLSNCVYSGNVNCTGTYSSQFTAYVQIVYASQTAEFTNCYLWGASKSAITTNAAITDGVTPVITVDGTSTTWTSAKLPYLSSAGVVSRIKNYMKSFNDDLVMLADEAQSNFEQSTSGALAVSEISHCPSNGIYEYIEIVNTSSASVSLDGYTVVRCAYVNSGSSERTAIQRIIGTSATLLPSTVASLGISGTGITLAPGEAALLWIASYNGKDKTVNDFTSFWNGKGYDMSGVKVARLVNYNSLGDLYPVTAINSKCGNGFLPDRYSVCSISLMDSESSQKRLSNGTRLEKASSPITVDDLHTIIDICDSYAFYITQSTAKTGYSFNYYSFSDDEAYRKALSGHLPEIVESYASTYPFTDVHPTFVTGELDDNGLPAMYNYNNTTDEKVVCAPFMAGGTLKNTSTPGALYDGQYINVRYTGFSVGASSITINGSAAGARYSDVGFAVYTTGADGVIKCEKDIFFASSISSNGSFKVTASGFTVDDGDIICITPLIKNGQGKLCSGVQLKIKYPQRTLALYSSINSDIRIAYFDEETGDHTGYYEAARLLADDLEYYTGEAMSVVPFDKHAGYRQIVVGSPAAAASFLPSGVSIGTDKYIIFGKFGNVFVIGDTALSAEYGAQTIVSALKSTTEELVATTLCSNTVKTFNRSSNTLPLTDGASFRIMTCNVERYELNTNLNRITDFVNTFKYYQPDVIGFQEYCATFTSNLTPKLQSLGYTVLGNEMITTGSQNYTPLAYKTSKFTCVAKGWFKLTGDSSYPGHNVTWAVLKDKTTGETFAATTTHFFHLSDRTKADPIRAINAQEIVDLTNEIVSKYGCAVVNMGDYNIYSTDVGYPVFFNTGVLSDSRFISQRDLFILRTSHADGSSTPSSGSLTIALDLFHVNDLVNVIKFKVPTNMTTASMSDHFPSFVDIKATTPSDHKTTTKNNAEYQVEQNNGYSVVKIPNSVSQSELLSMFEGNVSLSGGIVSGGQITKYLSGKPAESVYIILENDANGDGVVNTKDIIRAKKLMGGIHSDKLRQYAIDINGDGTISSSEYEALVKIIVG